MFQKSSEHKFKDNSFNDDYDELESDYKKKTKQPKTDIEPFNSRQFYYKQIQLSKVKQTNEDQQDSKQKKKTN